MCAFVWLERRTVSSKPSRLRHGHVLGVRLELLYTHRRAAAHQWQAKHVLVTHAKHGKGHWVGQISTWPHFTSRCSSSRSLFAGSPPELRDAWPTPPASSGAFIPRDQRLPRAVAARVPAACGRSGRWAARGAAESAVCTSLRYEDSHHSHGERPGQHQRTPNVDLVWGISIVVAGHALGR